MNNIDLHIHTNASDGELSPQQIVELALKKNLKAIAITDHDTVEGAKIAIKYASKKNIKVIPGIEISCYEKDIGFEEVHIIGLFIDVYNKKLINFTELVRKDRIVQKKRIIRKLNQLGFKIRFEDIEGMTQFSIGRPHIARRLVKNYPKEFKNEQEVFEQYIGVGKPAYAERQENIKAIDAIRLIKQAGGVPILAHPGVFKKEDSLDLINYFLRWGGLGIETFYPYNFVCGLTSFQAKSLNKFYANIAKKRKILQSGGSDFHSRIRKEVTLGILKIDYNILKEIVRKIVKNNE